MNGHWLVSDFTHRDPSDMLHDVDCGRYLDALQELPGGLRQMLQDGDMHVELVEFGGRYVIGKIIKKREPEFVAGSMRYFIYDNDGKRIPLDEEEFNKLLGCETSPDDVFGGSADVDLQTLDSEATPPMDVWDVVYDAMDYIRECRHRLDDDTWQENTPVAKKMKELNELADKLIYSSNWFPYPQDKRIHSTRAREIARQIEQGISRAQLGALIGPRNPLQKQEDSIRKIRARAAKMPAGPEKGKLLVKAQGMYLKILNERKADTTVVIGPKRIQIDTICDSDRAKLWSLWRERQMRTCGSVPLMPWQFEKAFRAKLLKQVKRGEMSSTEATQRLQDAMVRLYGGTKPLDTVKPEEAPVMPSWLQEVPERTETEYEFDAATQQPMVHLQSEFDPLPDDEEWVVNELYEVEDNY